LSSIDLRVDLKLLGDHSPGFSSSPPVQSKLKVCHNSENPYNDSQIYFMFK